MALAILAAGFFLLVGLLPGIWKYLAIMQSNKTRAPYYVDVAHHALLKYASAALILALILALLAYFSLWSTAINSWAVLASVIYFAQAMGTDVIHGVLKDTANQLRRPHQLGSASLPSVMIQLFMGSLIMAELGGTLVVLASTGRHYPFVALALVVSTLMFQMSS